MEINQGPFAWEPWKTLLSKYFYYDPRVMFKFKGASANPRAEGRARVVDSVLILSVRNACQPATVLQFLIIFY